jgi:Domain of unknown function (DUF5753)
MTLAELGARVPCDASTGPGILQTAEYARALFRAWRTDDDEDKVEQLVCARMDRQRIFDRPNRPAFWAVLDESLLRRRISGAKVMHDQLVHLADMGERATVKIHVVPAEAGAHVGLLGAFAIAGFDGDAPGIVTPGAWSRFADRVRSAAR